ncbi:ParA family protein [Sphingomonas melonis]|jgi:chromosome partitioning protein|uniref:Chromosome partitioning protein n=1 Tax=Sphingomonas melonis TaxID=152682 RepID=A0A7Y9FPS3_9SPHN|nr:ParA family protein [Sphingomonas melonis]NYD91226.1 chromosome partitioning protein [Sphingomonas melonis]
MPTIVLVSPKGGVGKTTAAMILANQLSQGAPVTVIDADPNRPFQSWAAGGNVPDNLKIVTDADEENIIDKIEEAAAATPFVIVDLEGTAAKIVVLAVSQADLVIVPTQGSQLDAEQAGRALRVIRQQEKMTRRPVEYGVLLTRTSPAIRTRTTTHIMQGLAEAGINVFDTHINEREAFRAMFSFRQTLEGLRNEEVNNLDKAINNANAFTKEVVDRLRAIQYAQQEEVA